MDLRRSGPGAETRADAVRKTGIPVLGDVPWGTHFCQFYDTRADLLEILVPYLLAGLEGSELCLWITCEPDDVELARRELLDASPQAAARLDAGDVQIVSCRDWYLRDGTFDPQRVLAAWRTWAEHAVARGYQGLRVHANEAWLTRKTWRAFADYEASIDGALAGLPILVLCTYPLEASSGAEIFDVARTHQLTVARREGAWEVMETVESVATRAEVERLNAELSETVEERTRELAGANAALRDSEELFRFITQNTLDLVTLYDMEGERVYISPSYVRVLGYLPPEPFGGVHPEDLPRVWSAMERIRPGGRTVATFRHHHADGTWHWLESVGALVHHRGRPHMLITTRDVTGRKRLEDEQREREALFRLLTENSNDLITLRTTDGRLVYGSPSAERVLGGPAAESPHRMLERYHPDDRESAVARWEAVAGGESAHNTFRFRRPDGAWVWVEAWAKQVTYRGEPHVLSVGRDVTARVEAERARVWLLESLEKVNRAIQGTTDLRRMTSDVLDAVLEIFDADRAALLYPADPHAPCWTVRTARGRGGTAAAPAGGPTVARTESGARAMELLCGSPHPVQFGEGPGQEPQGDLGGALGVRSSLSLVVRPKGDQPYQLVIGQEHRARDWTADEERLAEQIGGRLADAIAGLGTLRDLRVSEARFRVFVDHATDAFFLHDETGTILDANRQAAEGLGYTREELVGLGPADYDADSTPERDAAIAERLATGEVLTFQTRHRRRDGTLFPVEVRARGFVEHGRQFVVSLSRDTSERTRMEEEFRQAQKMEAVGRLAGGVAHDFNNLLTAILGYAELALLDLPPDSPTASDITEIRQAAERARGVTRQLLAFSRRKVLEAQVVELGAVVRGMERMLRLLVREDVHLEVRTPREPLRVSVDPIHAEQVLLNLVVNARDATPAGGRITVDVGFAPGDPQHGVPERAAGYARVVVADTGMGMTPETAARVFEPFFTTKPAEVGTGLGLSTVFGIVRQSGGHVRVDTAPGEGATFTVLLPMADEVQEEAEEALAPPRRDVAGVRVAVVEDEDAVRHFVVELLRRSGVEVLEFSAPAEALPVLTNGGPPVDVLVTDVVLPGMSGPDLVERVCRARPGLPVIYMSGYTAEEESFADVLRRATVLPKPFVPDDLLSRIAAVRR